VAFGFVYFALMTISGMRGHMWAQSGIPKTPGAWMSGAGSRDHAA
jgi:hypothetical protein